MQKGSLCYPHMTTLGQWVFKDANQAFSYLTARILKTGEVCQNTLAIRNFGFYIANPTDSAITEPWRKWSARYAEREWNWYQSHSRDVSELQKHAPTWAKMHGGDCQVNSNYGWQWTRNQQLKKVLRKLALRHDTRRAYITIYDGKEQDDYAFDTPCTLNIGFSIRQEANIEYLDMEVIMRSNDLIFGFCNDQYCFSKLQNHAAKFLDIKVGSYYHYASSLHIYNPFCDIYPEYIAEYLKEQLRTIKNEEELDKI